MTFQPSIHRRSDTSGRPKRYRRATGAAIAVAVVTLIAGGASAAQAAGPSSVTAHADENCLLAVDTGQLVCAPVGQDLNALVLAKTGKRVVTPSAKGTMPSTDAGSKTQAMVTLALLYEDQSYHGRYLQFAAGTGCNGTVYSISNLADFGFDNITDSYKSFGNCLTKIWESPNFANGAYGYLFNAPSVGSIHDKGSSVRIK